MQEVILASKRWKTFFHWNSATGKLKKNFNELYKKQSSRNIKQTVIDLETKFPI